MPPPPRNLSKIREHRSPSGLCQGLFASLCLVFLQTRIHAQTITETLLGTISLEGTIGERGHVISPDGDHYAQHERVGGKHRYVTAKGAGSSFDRLHPGAAWINGRLVYYAKRGESNYLVDGEQLIELKGAPTSPLISPRPWISQDHSAYSAFSSDGAKVTWYLNGKEQAQTFDRFLTVLDVRMGRSDTIFAGVNDCRSRLFGRQSDSETRWDNIHMIRSAENGSTIFIYGHRASLPVLFKDEEPVYQERLEALEITDDGKNWFGVADRSIEAFDHMVLIKNGEQLAEADVDTTRQRFYKAPHGSNWAWKILDESYTSATFILPDRQPLKLNYDPAEFHLVSDPNRYAYMKISRDPQVNSEINVNGVIHETKSAIVANTFRFGPGEAFAVVLRRDGREFVLSHLGEGEGLKSVSSLLFCENGNPVYAGDRGDQQFVVIGSTAIRINADTLFGLKSLQVKGNAAIVLGRRNKTIVKFEITKNQ